MSMLNFGKKSLTVKAKINDKSGSYSKKSHMLISSRSSCKWPINCSYSTDPTKKLTNSRTKSKISPKNKSKKTGSISGFKVS